MTDAALHLLETSDGVVVSSLSLDNTCIFTGDDIEDGVTRVYLTVRVNETGPDHSIRDHTVGLSISAISLLINGLEAASFEDGETLGSAEQVVVSSPDGQGCCCVCQEDVTDLSIGFGGHDAPVRCHVQCADTLTDGLGGIWDHSDKLLSDHV